jgi:hypothetical protein
MAFAGVPDSIVTRPRTEVLLNVDEPNVDDPAAEGVECQHREWKALYTMPDSTPSPAKTPRVRFAPSPTGLLHVGSARIRQAEETLQSLN